MKWVKRLILWYILFVAVKTLLSYLVFAPSSFSDGYIYAKMARGIFYLFDPKTGVNNPPLYPLFLSLSYVFKDMTLVYTAMKFLNSLLSSLIIFPAWFLAKEFFTKKVSLKLAILISLIPPIFAFAPLIMSENLYFPLFLSSFYFIYRSFTTPHYKWDVLSGIFLGFSLLSRVISVALVAGLLALIFFNYFHRNHTSQFKRKLVLFMFLILILSTLILNNFLLNGFDFSVLLGKYSDQATFVLKESYPFERVIPTFFINLGYAILSLLGIYFLSSLTLFRDYKKNYKLFILGTLTFSTFLAFMAIKVNHGIGIPAFLFDWIGGQVIGRYLAAIFPMFFILGSLGFTKKYDLPKKYLFLGALILAFTANIMILPLFPINNMSLTYLGVLAFFLKNFISNNLLVILFSAIFFTIPFISYYIYKKFSFKKIVNLTLVCFILLGILNYSVIIFNANTFWYQGDQMQLGLWLNDYDKKESVVVFDIKDTGEKIWKQNQSILCDPNACIMGFWLNDRILIGDPSQLQSDFIISKHKLPYPVIKEQGGIYIYEGNNNNSGL
jgi:hypothetical protein